VVGGVEAAGRCADCVVVDGCVTEAAGCVDAPEAMAVMSTMAAVRQGVARARRDEDFAERIGELGIIVRAIPLGIGRIGKFTDGCGRRKSCSGSWACVES